MLDVGERSPRRPRARRTASTSTTSRGREVVLRLHAWAARPAAAARARQRPARRHPARLAAQEPADGGEARATELTPETAAGGGRRRSCRRRSPRPARLARRRVRDDRPAGAGARRRRRQPPPHLRRRPSSPRPSSASRSLPDRLALPDARRGLPRRARPPLQPVGALGRRLVHQDRHQRLRRRRRQHRLLPALPDAAALRRRALRRQPRDHRHRHLAGLLRRLRVAALPARALGLRRRASPRGPSSTSPSARCRSSCRPSTRSRSSCCCRWPASCSPARAAGDSRASWACSPRSRAAPACCCSSRWPTTTTSGAAGSFAHRLSRRQSAHGRRGPAGVDDLPQPRLRQAAALLERAGAVGARHRRPQLHGRHGHRGRRARGCAQSSRAEYYRIFWEVPRTRVRVQHRRHATSSTWLFLVGAALLLWYGARRLPRAYSLVRAGRARRTRCSSPRVRAADVVPALHAHRVPAVRRAGAVHARQAAAARGGGGRRARRCSSCSRPSSRCSAGWRERRQATARRRRGARRRYCGSRRTPPA